MKTVREILAEKGDKIWAIGPKASAREAMVLMNEKAIGALLVRDDAGKVRGIMSERDCTRKLLLQGRTPAEVAVAEIMTPAERMFMVKPSQTVEDCMVVMTAEKVRHLPVFDGTDFVGLVSIGDAVKALLSDKQALIDQLSDYISGKYT